MKYIIWSLITITLVLVVTFIQAPLKFIWHLIWHFEIISFQHATSVKCAEKRVYLYDCSPKQFFLEILFYKYDRNLENE